MKTLSLLLLAAGLVLGPVYWIYAKFYSGSQAALVPLTLVDAAAGTWRSAEFKMTADMAPVGLILKSQGSFAPNMDESRPPKDLYAALLSRAGESAKPLGFELNAGSTGNSNPVFNSHLVLFQTVKDGGYQLEIQPSGPPNIPLQKVELEVRQHLVEPNPNIVMAGVLLLVFGILGLVMV
ncbi:MAG: hypothetical protein Q8Q28_01295 [Pseudomonadota bacterium]|nr:hypothetical protein [Pseudomonadota bacterium]